ncbi:hypothetical protein PsYK624_051640 [Phanerochaete sordida]|uniref:Uncharacterized protein n=1 Tax=Phanerochaete sordida TaxID=48140 RepID=A0A9P3G6R4_9APHY|nr:hypothetical protein PsYK624_051640 [Phanerochaete sordida]
MNLKQGLLRDLYYDSPRRRGFDAPRSNDLAYTLTTSPSMVEQSPPVIGYSCARTPGGRRISCSLF